MSNSRLITPGNKRAMRNNRRRIGGAGDPCCCDGGGCWKLVLTGVDIKVFIREGLWPPAYFAEGTGGLEFWIKAWGQEGYSATLTADAAGDPAEDAASNVYAERWATSSSGYESTTVADMRLRVKWVNTKWIVEVYANGDGGGIHIGGVIFYAEVSDATGDPDVLVSPGGARVLTQTNTENIGGSGTVISYGYGGTGTLTRIPCANPLP